MVYISPSNEYVSRTVKRYSSLFTLPSHRRILILLLVLCTCCGTLSALLMKSSYEGLVTGLILGVSLFFTTVMSDSVTYHTCMKKDPIFNLRRCSALSIFSSVIWFGFLILGSIVSVALKDSTFWIKLCLLGFCAALTLRLLVFWTTSFVGLGGVFVSSILQPALFITPNFLMVVLMGYGLEADIVVFLLVSIPISLMAVLVFTYFVNRVGRRILKTDSLFVFKLFMVNWMENLSEPLESFFEKFGGQRDIKLSILAFRSKQKMKALMVVPTFHPGPFKNVGSSLLPYTVQKALEKRLNCVVSVPHGISGHELDLSSKRQNQKIVRGVLSSIDFPSFNSKAAPFVRTQRDEASASCQMFGNCVLLTLTLSPKTMEDLPQELDHIIVTEAEKRGLSSTIVVDAHNSIEGPFDLGEAVEPLRSAAVTSIEETLRLSRSRFEIGAAKVVPQEFGLEDGMGPGGITAIVTMVGNQKTAYVTIDGNNMISSLREKILSALQEVGIVGGEILTTDTHAVNGVVLTERGYRPIGEVMDEGKLIGYIKQAVTCALRDLEPAEVSYRTLTISDVNVIGEKQINNLCLLVDKAAKQAKRLAILIFPTVGTILTAWLLFL